MRQWTSEERLKQSMLIQNWKPWLRAGVKTPKGKRISSMNALKHGLYSSEMRLARKMIDQCLDNLKLID